MARCWAHNHVKVRCQLDAGHDGLHMISSTWSDDECYEPEKTVHSLVPNTGTITIPTTVTTTMDAPPAPSNDRCVACQHKHRGRECPGACECKEFIG